jgi:hypothetical protein
MTIRLIAIDLDGTLMGPDLVISPANRAAIAAATARGVTVTIATGRMVRATAPFARQLGLSAPLICYQGALVAAPDTGAVLMHRPVPLELARQVIELSKARRWHLHLYVDDELCVEAITPEVASYTSLAAYIRPKVVGDLGRFLDRPPTKMLIIGRPDETQRTLGALGESFDGRLYLTMSLPTYTEIAAAGCSKGLALEWLAGRMGIAREETMAIGDAPNDAEMVRWAGVGVAMGGAGRELVAAAGHQTAELSADGVAKAIERFVLCV